MIERILETKRKEVEILPPAPIAARTKPVVPFCLKEGTTVIAELKRRSPSAGPIGEVDEARIAAYSRHAGAISVLTDRSYFGGSFGLLRRVAAVTDLPVLAKDFFIHESQIDWAYAMGADMVLLIVRALGGRRLSALYAHARALGLECLVEVHRREELVELGDLDPRMVGVNARDLDTLAMNPQEAAEVLSTVAAPVRVAESGIRTRQDMARYGNAHAFLVGEVLMASSDPESTLRGLVYG